VDNGFNFVAPEAALSASGPESADAIITEAEWRRRERSNLVAALRHAGGRVYGADGAASLLGVKPSTLSSRLKSLGIQPAGIQ
jgi:transcriptional regulator with GAF, ATPase, and Fis domain